ncbi:MAG: DUF3857 domain-containing protein [Thermoanaerobaculia bacterium]|nr:DUF3857 domain-containing protein [Thermoanaerobaculia bacterium]
MLHSSLLWVALAATPHPAVSQGPVPAWVEERDPIPEGLATSGALLDLSEDDQIRVDGPRTARYHESIVAVGSREGLEEAAEWEVAFAPTFERITLHRLEVQRRGRWQDRLAAARTVLLQPAGDRLARLYDDTLTLVFVADDVRVGDRVRFAYTIAGTNPVFGTRYHGTLGLAWQTPIVRRTARVLYRVADGLSHRVHGTGPLPFIVRAGDDWRELRWRLTGFAAPPPEARVPDDWFQEPFVQLSQYGSWGEVVAWALPLYRSAREPEVVALARELAAGGSPAARALAAVRFVQDEVRYFAAPVGPASHAPQAPTEVLRRRYGDCKDKSRLLVELLRELGIEAWPAFVASELHGGIREFLPAPSAFDHVIVAARLDGRTFWIDPSDSLQGGGAADLYLSPYALALEIRPGVEELTELPPEASLPGTHSLTYHYRFGAPGEAARVTIETTAERFQADSLRRTLAGSSAADLFLGYLDFYRGSGRAIEVAADGAPEVIDDREANRLTLRESYRLLDCLGTAPCPLLPLLLTEELEAPLGGPRRAPWRLTPDVHLQETVVLEGTTGQAAVSGQEVNPWFDFRVTGTPRPDGLELRYELRTLAPAVRPRDFAPYRHAVEKARALAEFELEPPPRGAKIWVWWIGAGLALVAVVGLGIRWAKKGDACVAPTKSPPR